MLGNSKSKVTSPRQVPRDLAFGKLPTEATSAASDLLDLRIIQVPTLDAIKLFHRGKYQTSDVQIQTHAYGIAGHENYVRVSDYNRKIRRTVIIRVGIVE